MPSQSSFLNLDINHVIGAIMANPQILRRPVIGIYLNT
ncbi:MAG: hypothetical protein HXL57_00065 [Solobacterium sp.]|nr:hypothetical protein [Solobacterium sp.]